MVCPRCVALGGTPFRLYSLSVCSVGSPPVKRLFMTSHSKALGNGGLTGPMAILRSETIYDCSLDPPSNAVAIGTSN